MRNVVWFSCGAASAVTAKLAIDEGLNPTIVYCDTMKSEHPDNKRFFNECEEWFGQKIIKIASKKYSDIDDVFEKTKFMSSPFGARCTTEMKKVPRYDFQRVDDTHYFGFNIEECKRIINFKRNNFELTSRYILAYYGLTKEDCKRMLPMEEPTMYRKGFNNNNCLGCVKAQSPKYWNLTRIEFPDVFAKRCDQSRRFKVRLVKIGKKRIFLDELEPDNLTDYNELIECGVTCQTVGDN